jgi:hypothetical protein
MVRAISIPSQQIVFLNLELERLQAAGFDLPLPAAFFAFVEIDTKDADLQSCDFLSDSTR